jgi:class 3 adenylate cyclase
MICIINFLQEFDELVVNLSKEIGIKYYEAYGDGLMYQFFDEDDKTCVMNALKAAVMIKERFSNSSFNQQRRKEGKAEFGMRFGIHTGLAKVSIYPGRTKPQAKGFMLNVAKRIEDEVTREAKNTKICLSEKSYELVKDKIKARELGNFSLKGISFKIKVYEFINYF